MDALGQVRMWIMCSSGVLQSGQFDCSLCPRRFITRPDAILPLMNLEIKRNNPKRVEVRLKRRQSHETLLRKVNGVVSKKEAKC